MSFLTVEKNGVVFLRSTLLPCPHAFSTRIGGVSTAPHLRSLNVGENRGDDPANVRENLRRLCAAADLPQTVVSAAQVHSAALLYVDAPPAEKPQLDGFYTDRAGLTLCVKIADCLPILIHDRKKGFSAALHAGWRGSASGIARKGVEALVSLGSDPRDLLCALGPCIGVCCFEVRDDFIAEFTALAGGDAARRCISVRSDKYYADLKALNADALALAGVPEAQIDVCPDCTCCRHELYFSHRYTKGLRGTMCALIAAAEK